MKHLATIIGSIVIIIVLACLLLPVLGWLFDLFLVIACGIGIVTIVKYFKGK